MKKIYSIFAVSMLSMGAFAQTVEVNETFSFTGPLNANGWTTHSGATPGQIQAASGMATLVAGNTEDVNKALATAYAITAGAVNKVSYSATVNVLNSTGLTTTGDYFLSLGATTGSSSITVLPARLHVKAGTTGYLLGILNTSSGTATYSTTEIPYGTAADVTVNYIVETGTTTTQTATLQINSQPLLTNASGTAAVSANIASVALRQGGNATSGTGNVTVDNIVVTSFAKTTLAVDNISATQAKFVQNTVVTDGIKFGLKSDVKVYNMNGQIVKSAAVEKGSTLNVSSLPKGIYIVTGNIEGQVVSQKITKN